MLQTYIKIFIFTPVVIKIKTTSVSLAFERSLPEVWGVSKYGMSFIKISHMGSIAQISMRQDNLLP